MKRFTLSTMIVVLVLCVAMLLPGRVDAASYSGTCGTGVSWSLDTTTGVLNITGSGAMTNWSSYSSVSWYSYRSYIKTVKIGSGVTRVGNYAFYNCTALTEVSIPSTVTTVGTYAFHASSSLSKVNYGGTLSNWRSTTINSYNTYLTAAPIYCSDNAVLVPSAQYPQSAHNYANNTNDTQTFTWPGAEKLELCFSSSTKTESNYDFIYVYDSAGTQLAKYSGTTAASKVLTVTGDTVKIKLTSDGSSVYYGYSFSYIVAYVSSSGSCGTSANWSFDSSTGNLAITGSGAMDTYTTGGAPWYGKAASITTITVSKDITSIGAYAFEDLPALTKITFSGTYTQWKAITKGAGNETALANVPVHCDASGEILLPSATYPESAHPYANNTNETKTFTYPGAKILKITFSSSSEAEEDYDYIYVYDGNGTQLARYDDNAANKTLVISGDTFKVKLTSDGSSTEYGYSFSEIIACDKLSGVLNDSLTWELTDAGKLIITGSGAMPSYSSGGAPWYSFRNNITSVELDSRITSIGQYAFYFCSNMTSVNMPASLTSIGSNAFAYCSKLTSVTVPAGVTSIGNYAFASCKALTRIDFNATSMTDCVSNNYIFQYAGQNGTGITVNIGAGVKSVPAYLFYPYSTTSTSSYTPKITAVTFTQGSVCTTIGSCAFTECAELTAVNLPDSLTTISSSAFYDCSGLTAVSIPNSVTSIGGLAFYNCGKLTSVSIPAGVTSIGNNAFGCCASLTGITVATGNTAYTSDASGVLYNKAMTQLICVPAGISGSYTVPAGVTSIEESTFRQCTKLTSVTLPDSVTTLGAYAFYGCSGLTSVTLGSSITAIPEYAFYGCSGLTSFVIPDKVTSVGTYAFSGCSGLKSLTIGFGVKTLSSYAFYNCTGLTEINLNAEALSNLSSNNYVFAYAGKNGTGITVNVAAHATAVPAYLFYPCNAGSANVTAYTPKIIAVSFAKGQVAKTVGNYAFYGSTGITSLDLGGLVTSVGSYAFYGCTGLKSLTFGADLKTVGSSAFYGCTALEQFTFHATEMSALTGGNSVLRNAGTGSGMTVTIGANVKKIPAYLFCPYSGSGYAPKLKSVTFSEGSVCTEIGNYAFAYCSGSFSLTLPETVTSIGTYAFYYAPGVTSVTFPKSLTSFGSYAFTGSGLTSAVLPEGMTELASSAFSGCSKLASVTLPESLTSIGSSAFSGCSALTHIVLPKNLTSLGNSAFYNCTALTRIDLHAQNLADLASENKLFYNAGKNGSGITFNVYSTATRIPAYLFYPTSSTSYSPNLTSVCFAENSVCTEIGQYAFQSCATLQNAVFAEGLTTIGSYAFSGCGGLTALNLPNSLTTVGAYAFNLCRGITAVSVSSMKEWCEISFANGSANPLSYGAKLYTGGQEVTDLYIPYGVTAIGSYAFYNCSALTGATLPFTLTSIGDGAFYNCAGITSVNIPAAVSYIGTNAFYGCTGLSALWVEDGNSHYSTDLYGVLFNSDGTQLLLAPQYLSGHYEIPEGVTSIAGSAFRGCSKLTEVTIPTSVTTIGTDAFYQCSGLTKVNISDLSAWCGISFGSSYANPLYYSHGLYLDGAQLTDLEIPEGVKSISPYAFYYCNTLTTVTLPKSLTTIGSYAFQNVSPTQVRYHGTPEQWTAISKGTNNTNVTGASVYYTSIGAVLVPSSQYPQSSHNYTNNLNETKTFTYAGAKMLKITFSESTKTQSYYDFIYIYDGADTLISSYSGTSAAGVSLIVPGDTFKVKLTSDYSTTYYGYAFSSIYAYDKQGGPCGENISWELDDNGTLTISGTGAMEDYTGYSAVPWYSLRASVKEIVIAEGVTKVGNYAFCQCKDATSVTIPDTVTAIGTDAFTGCSGLTAVTIPGSVTTVGSSAFSSCSNLTQLTISEGVSSIGYYAFQNCKKLTAVTLPASLESLDNAAFSSCSGLTAFRVHEDNANYSSDETGVIFNKDRTTLVLAPPALSGSYSIPEGVTSIESNAFFNCDALTAVTVPGGVTAIGSRAFYDCDALSTVTVPGSVTTLGSYAFYSCDALTSVDIRGSVTTVGTYTFSYCSKLASVCLPATLKTVETYAFNGCSGLTQVRYGGAGENWPTVTISTGNTSLTACNIYCEASEGYFLPVSTYPQSTHDYGVNLNETKTFTYEGAKMLTVTFSDKCSLGYAAHAYLYEGDSSSYFASFSQGTDMAGRTYRILGDTFRIRLSTSSYTTDYGYAFSSIIAHDKVSGRLGESLRWEIDDAGILTISGTGDMVNYTGRSETPWYTFRDMIKGVVVEEGVTSVGSYAFSYCDALTSVTIPGSVKTIGDAAFLECNGLTTLTMTEGVTDIGRSAFGYCNALTSVTIPGSVTTIGASAFYNCDALTAVTVPGSVATIGSEAFSSCNALAAVTISEGVTTIGGKAFYNCDALTSVTVPGSVTTIGGEAFSNCDALAAVTISEGVITIGDKAFYNCDALTAVTVSAGVTEIGDSAFSSCDNLAAIRVDAQNTVYASDETGVLFSKDMTVLLQAPNGLSGDYSIPAGVTSISDRAFYSCTKLTAVTIPDSVTEIGSYAFYGCTGLTAVTLPERVTEIGSYAFYGCTGLTSVTLGSITAIPDYAFYGCTGLTAFQIPDTVTSIGENAFYDCTGLTAMTIPGSVATIGSKAFGSCGALTAVTISEGVTTIGSDAFYNCGALTAVTIPGSVKTIGNRIFCGCDLLTSVTLSEGLTEISDSAFYNCVSLTSVNIPKGVTSIGSYAFNSCTGLRAVSIPNTVTSIGGSAFNKCTSLTSVTIPDSVKTLGTYTFEGCTGLVNVTIGSGITGLEDSVFRGCTSLREVRGKGSIGWFGNGTFNGCTSLIRVSGMELVDQVGDYAFYNCAALKSFDAAGLGDVGEYAFYGCAALEKVVLTDYMGYIEQYAFYGCTSLRQLTISYGVTLNSYAFGDCPNIKSIYIYGYKPSYSLSSISFPANAFSGITATVYYPVGFTVNSGLTFGTNCSLTWVQSSSGFCGYNATWSYDEATGVLTISGTGGVFSDHTGSAMPWSGVIDDIRKIYINDGITHLPQYCFEYIRNATEVRLPNTLTYLAANALNDCSALNNLLIPASLKAMKSGYYFNRCTALTDIYYVGTLEDWKQIPGATCYAGGKDANLHTLQLQPSTATCAVPGLAAHYAFAEPTVYTQLYDLNKYPISTVPAAPATGNHTYKEVAAVAPTCTETGLTAGTVCEVCGTAGTAQEVVPALGHTCKTLAAVAPTCTESGLTAGSVCEVCDQVVVAQEVVPALGHNMDESGNCTVCGPITAAAVTADGTVYYGTLAQAAENAANGYLLLCADVTEALTVSGDCYLDLNGFTLTGDITVENGTLYLIDGATADYTAENRGKVVGNITGNISRNFKVPAVYGQNYTYLVLQEEDGSWSAHRYYLAVESAVVSPWRENGTAVNYKTAFESNALVRGRVTQYGAKLTGKITIHSDALDRGFVLGSGTNHAITRLVNTLSLKKSHKTNLECALVPITTNAYIVIDGMEVCGVEVTVSLQDLLVMINDRTDLTEEQKTGLGQMYAMFRSVIDALEVDLSNIKSYLQEVQ